MVAAAIQRLAIYLVLFGGFLGLHDGSIADTGFYIFVTSAVVMGAGIVLELLENRNGDRVP